MGSDWTLPFQIYIDASDYSIGVVLGQKSQNLENVIYYISKSLHGLELNYTVTEKELLLVVYALNKFWHYVTGYPIFVHANHTKIKYLMNKPSIIGRLARWLLLLQEFDITIIDKPGKENAVADYLYRIHHDEEDTTLIDDTFVDENLFHIAFQTLGYADMDNYIASNKMPTHFSYKDIRLLVEKRFHFSWIDNTIFYIEPDLVMRRYV